MKICSNITLHHPQNMDTVCSLSLMQEEESDNGKKWGVACADSNNTKFLPKYSNYTDKHKPNGVKKDDSVKLKIIGSS